ncbi:BnaC03g74510D [Brassica napus]|uniref:BnaC03g74510D protein n=1 Tax=Brassica napus TaxID=3708 RepID=A0A078IMX1_BRANA|nr:BnaC03g74510D [Brassica napus]
MADHQFAWILWYIWKGMTNKVFSNIDIDPIETLKLVETESILWAEAQLLNINRATQPVEVRNLQSIPLRWCFTYGSWKDKEPYSGQGWYIILEAFEMYLENIKILKASFLNSKIIHVPRMENSKADNLARNVRKRQPFVVHMDAELPVWFTESV